MDILETAIQTEGGVGKLAETLDIAQNVISNWRKRGVPKPWRQVLDLRYASDTRLRAWPELTPTTHQPTPQEVPHV